MMDINIPGFGPICIKHVVFDYNGTVAKDGSLIKGVRHGIKQFSSQLEFHVITADTFGFVKKELKDVKTNLTIIPKDNQAQSKLDYVSKLGLAQTISVGNGANDELMLKEACIGIAVLQEEGLASSSFMAADLMVRDILDIFDLFKTPERLIATLRT
jgi:soluble P-type ATPase